jgi:hypothetical protein
MAPAGCESMMKTQIEMEVAVIEFLAANWVWIAAIALFIAMHRGGHGCGGHGQHQQKSADSDTERAHHNGGGRST